MFILQRSTNRLQEIHNGMCGCQQPRSKLWDRLPRMGYYWPRLITNTITYAKRYHACQIRVDYLHQLLENLHPMTASWPFKAWGIDVVGPITLCSSKDYRYILAIIGYFSKWSKAMALKEVKISVVVKFIKKPLHLPVLCSLKDNSWQPATVH